MTKKAALLYQVQSDQSCISFVLLVYKLLNYLAPKYVEDRSQNQPPRPLRFSNYLSSLDLKPNMENLLSA